MRTAIDSCKGLALKGGDGEQLLGIITLAQVFTKCIHSPELSPQIQPLLSQASAEIHEALKDSALESEAITLKNLVNLDITPIEPAYFSQAVL